MIYNNVCNKSKQLGISINALEKRADLSVGSICKWNVVSPTARSLKKVADILKCSVDELLKETEVPVAGKEG